MELEIIEAWEARDEEEARGLQGVNGSVDPTGGSNGSDGGYDFIARHKHIAVPYLTFIAALTLIGTLGNLLVLGTLVINKRLRTIGNIFVANLAFADLCVTGFANPFSIVGMVFGKSWFDANMWLCQTVGFVCTVSCIVSILTIVMISVNRYVHICHGTKTYIRVYTRTNTLLMAFSLWFVSSLLQLSVVFDLADYTFDTKSHGCLWDRTHPRLFMSVALGAAEVLGAVVVFFCYLHIFLFVRNTRNNVSSSRTAQREREESLKLARTIAIIFFVYFFCWMPYTVVSLGDRADRLSLTLHLWTLTFAHANSSFNSIVYATTNKQFRIGYMRLLLIDRCVARVRAGPPDEVDPPTVCSSAPRGSTVTLETVSGPVSMRTTLDPGSRVSRSAA